MEGFEKGKDLILGSLKNLLVVGGGGAGIRCVYIRICIRGGRTGLTFG